MIANEKDKEAIRKSDSKCIEFEMTEERRALYKSVSDLIIDLLKTKVSSPAEAYGILRFVVNGFEQTYGIRGGLIFEKSDERGIQ